MLYLRRRSHSLYFAHLLFTIVVYARYPLQGYVTNSAPGNQQIHGDDSAESRVIEHSVASKHEQSLMRIMTEGAVEEEVFKRVAAVFRDIQREINQKFEVKLEEKLHLAKTGFKTIAEERMNEVNRLHNSELISIRESHREETVKLRGELRAAKEAERKWLEEKGKVIDSFFSLESTHRQTLEEVRRLQRQLEEASVNERKYFDSAQSLEKKASEALGEVQQLRNTIETGKAERIVILDSARALEKEEGALQSEWSSILESNRVLKEKVEQLQEYNLKLSRNLTVVTEMAEVERNTSVVKLKNLEALTKRLNETTITLQNDLVNERKQVKKIGEEKEALLELKSMLQDKHAALKMENKVLKSKQSSAAIEEEVFKRLASKVRDVTKHLELKHKIEVNQQVELARIGWKHIMKDNMKVQQKQHEIELESLRDSHKREMEMLKHDLTSASEQEILIEKEHQKIMNSSSILEKKIRDMRSNAEYFEKAFVKGSEEIKKLQKDLNATIEEEVFKSLAAQIRNIERDIGLKWKADVEELTHHLEAAEESTELVRLGAKQLLKDKLRDSEKHSKELEELRLSHREEIQKIQERIDDIEAERKTLIDSALLLESDVKQAKTNADYFEKAFDLCSEEVQHRDDVIAKLEMGNCKPIEPQINKIEHEIELNWKADVHELTVLHKVNLQEAERKLEMVRIGAHARTKDRLKKVGEQHAKEINELRATHQEELEKVLGEVGVAAEKVKRWEKERKTIIDSALLLESKAKQIRADALFWRDAFNHRSYLNVTYIEEGASAFLWVAATPIAGSLLGLYELTLKYLVKLSENLFTGLLAVSDHLLSHQFQACPKTLDAIKLQRGESSRLVLAVGMACKKPERSVESFFVAAGLLVVMTYLITRPLLLALHLLLSFIIGYKLDGNDPESAKDVAEKNEDHDGKPPKRSQKHTRKKNNH